MSDNSSGAGIDALQWENRRFPPSEEFKRQHVGGGHVHVRRRGARRPGLLGPAGGRSARLVDRLDDICEWDLPFAKWFVGGQLNVSHNCLDRHVVAGRGDKVAFYWEGEPGDSRVVTYAELLDETQRFANVLKGLGVAKGDRVNIYLPMIPEAAVAMLACARIGAAHSVVFGGFSAHSLRDRINDAEAKVLDHRRRRLPPRRGVRAEAGRPTRRWPTRPASPAWWWCAVAATTCRWQAGRDHWYHDLMADRRPGVPRRADGRRAAAVPAVHLGHHRQAEGHHAHQRAATSRRWRSPTSTCSTCTDDDVYWCTADVGWVTGHSYIVYGPLANGATQVMYEGVPNFPGNDRFWAIIEKYGVTKFYTAPTAIRTFMKWGDRRAGEARPVVAAAARLGGRADQPRGMDVVPRAHRRQPLPDRRHLVADRDRRHHDQPAARAPPPPSPVRPRSRCPASAPRWSTRTASAVERGGGYLTLTRPWPGMLRGIWGDPERYRETYWSRFEGRYFAGDGAKLDDDGYLWLLGRVDDVMNVSGHRISTTEVESALVSHPSVAEAAVVGANDPTTGQAIIAYVTLRGGLEVDGADAAQPRRPPRSARSPSRRRSTSRPICPRRAAARSCADCCATWPRAATWATPRTLADANVVNELQRRAAETPAED